MDTMDPIKLPLKLPLEVMPATIVVLLSSVILLFQVIGSCKIGGYQELSSKDTGDTPLGSTRFSTVKRDVTKIVIILLQIGQFGCLFYLRHRRNENESILNSVSIMIVCWLYALILTIISIASGSKKWGWIINIHLSAFYVTAVLCSMWQIRTVYYSNADFTALPIVRLIKLGFSLANFVLSLIITIVVITTPRGPPLINNNRPVFAAEYCSLWDFIMFNTVNLLMKKAYQQTSFNDSDFDQLPYSLRTSSLYNDFKRWRDRSLLYRIMKNNKNIILLQSLLTAIAGLLYYVPFIFLYQFIEFIKDYRYGESLEWGIIYLFGMFLSNVATQILVAQVWYWSSSVLQVVIKGQLNVEIYSKALKRYDSNATSIFEGGGDDDDKKRTNDNEDSGKDNEDDNDDISQNATIGKITNLMAVDTNRISEFITWWSNIIGCPIELCVGFYLLYQLLGTSCIYGLLVIILTLPINYQTAKSYNKTQDKLMEARDRRVDLMNEVLQGIRMIKFYAWEKNWENRILDSRRIELKQLRDTYIYLSLFDFTWIVSPVLVTITSFFVFTKVQGHELTASIAFTSLSVFNELRFALNVIPEIFMDGSQAYVSLKRIQKFLNEDEIANSEEDRENILGQENKIGFENATVTWNKPNEKENDVSEPMFRMKNLNLEFPIGKLSIICGPTGSGKTLLLMSLIGETYLINGKVHCPKSPTDPINYDLNPSNWILPNSIALVAQQAWLQNASIRSNITFGLPYDEDRYETVIKMCSLEKDLEIFEDGDLTEIGEKGITLSGGQKQRVALARAVYSRAKHILLDDVLSAVDAHTAKHLMNECILGRLMKGRTIILVTHQIRLCLKGASYLVAIDNGKITASGTLSDLKSSGVLSTVLEEADSRSEYVKDSAELAAENVVKDDAIKAKSHATESSTSSSDTFVENVENETNLDDVQKAKKQIVKKPRVLVEEEERATGAVKSKIYKTYLRANGHIVFWSLVIVVYIVTRMSQIMESWWLKVWSTASLEDNVNNNYSESSPFLTSRVNVNITAISGLILSTFSFNQHQEDKGFLSAKILPLNSNGDDQEHNESHSTDYYLNIYILITVLSSLLGVLRFTILYYGGLRASRRLYRNLLQQVLRAPLRFFDTTPVGRILNRFSKDFETIDSKLSVELSWVLLNVLLTITTVFVITAITKEFAVAAVVTGIIYTLVGILYTKASRECKRLDSVTRSPLYSHFTETLIGISTIRTYGATKRFMQDMFNKIDKNHRAFFNMWVVNRWLSIRCNLIGAFVSLFAGVFLLYDINEIDSGLAGLSLSFALNYSEQIMWTIRRYSVLEMSLNAVERVCEFSELPQEAPAIISPRPPAAWPHRGKIKVENLEVRYAEDLEPVLHLISFNIKGGERVGIVGRTGSGKSTIALSLFRFLEPSNGRILIDGINISSIGIEDLRSRITIIPQDPILFTGTIRSNLDAFSQYEDFEILSSLKRVHLIPSELEQITASDSTSSDRRGSVGGRSLASRRGSRNYDNVNVFKNLDTLVSEGGKNFSQGQRQLLCLARALLRSTKVILMDEATSSIDFDTDEKIQKMIRTEFVDCTIICIAHRLRTIIDYDKILVLDQGNIVEFDSPHNLITNHETLFYKMCQNSGEFDQLMSLALKKGNKDV